MDDFDKLREVKEEIKKNVKASFVNNNDVNEINCRQLRPSYIEIYKNTSFLPDTTRLSGNADNVIRAFQDFS
jgi:hypothetical protein